ncbi:MAG: aquaporin Z [Corynebacterium sp.]|uniref:aquaporin Z n=1 Tax=Corynebacterium sp. TaxID=1720 RepID=UPI002647341B|nr:aquaporin Z [Corynebacterium sp.]MDN5721910.1 aquaporin Z [Corynebacterium sp.]MDN6281877.1 aquaporin Z [Corynebacterium sp.]MDN6305089.1 aquaporin Z [Corynebacterium sp.]MDN6351735.1 aquaporin Z [Corynebacterium sp.]MDN6367265.1 aquaporin Z [Corynebacterium sp.]
MQTPSTSNRLWAEFLGTFWLTFGGCGSAVLAASVISDGTINTGIGFLGVALAFGLTVVTGAYALAHVSGAHFNPAVTLGCAVAKRIEWSAVVPYWVTQIIGASAAGGVLFVIASGKDGFSASESGFATNGYGEFSPDGYSMAAVLVAEVVLTAVFLWVILGVTSQKAPAGFAPLAIGLTLTLIHLISIPVSNTSVNPARSLGVAWFAGGDALGQVWLFIVAPLLGAAIAGISYAVLTGDKDGAESETVDA